MVAVFALPPAVLVGVVAGLLGGALTGLLAAVVVGLALASWGRFGGDRRLAGAVGGRLADPGGDARLCNLVEGLSTQAGVRQPELKVVDSPGLNALAAGTAPARAVVAVTSGLLAELTRIELEAVLAEALIQVRRGETLPLTVLAGTFGVGRRYALLPDRETEADQAAVRLTRYPPGLMSALEKIATKGGEVTTAAGPFRHCWLADPGPPDPAQPGRLDLYRRIEALREL